MFGHIRQWAEDRNLIEGSTPDKQLGKLIEEIGELAAGIARKRSPDDVAEEQAVLELYKEARNDV